MPSAQRLPCACRAEMPVSASERGSRYHPAHGCDRADIAQTLHAESGFAGRRRARRVHVGRARSPARGTFTGVRRRQRHEQRCDERAGAGARLARGRPRRCTRGADAPVGENRGADQPDALGFLDAWRRRHRDGPAEPDALFHAAGNQSARHQSPPRYCRESVRFRAPARIAAAHLPGHHARARWRPRRVRQCEGLARCAAGECVPAAAFCACADRWRVLLGRWLRRQSGPGTADLRMPQRRHIVRAGAAAGTVRTAADSACDSRSHRRTRLFDDFPARARDRASRARSAEARVSV
jgi:hypothetical protein